MQTEQLWDVYAANTLHYLRLARQVIMKASPICKVVRLPDGGHQGCVCVCVCNGSGRPRVPHDDPLGPKW